MNSPKNAPLLPHPATPCTTVERIDVSIECTDVGGLAISYRLRGKPDAVFLPPQLPSGPADNLWQHTCCEIFIATVNRKNYLEFNFSPSGQWAAYRFSDYRERDMTFSPAAAPTTSLQTLADGFLLDASIPPELLPADAQLHISLTAVIENIDAHKTYWAVQHCAAQPDFHLRQSFALTLNRPTP